MTIAEKDNLTKELTEDGRLVLEPGYTGYLRANGYKIRDIVDIDTVESDSTPDKKYLVCRIETFGKPKDHPNLDYVADKATIPVCTCWDWRSNHSADLEEQSPEACGSCKHLRQTFKAINAQEDENQSELL